MIARNETYAVTSDGIEFTVELYRGSNRSDDPTELNAVLATVLDWAEFADWVKDQLRKADQSMRHVFLSATEEYQQELRASMFPTEEDLEPAETEAEGETE